MEPQQEVEVGPHGPQAPPTQEEMVAMMVSLQHQLAQQQQVMQALQQASSSQAPIAPTRPTTVFDMAKLLDLKPPKWDGKGDIEQGFVFPWREFIRDMHLDESNQAVLTKIVASLPTDVQTALRHKKTVMVANNESEPKNATELFDLLLKLRPPLDRMRLAIDKISKLKLQHTRMIDYNQLFIKHVNQLASLTVEQVLAYWYVSGLTGEVRKEVETKFDYKRHTYSEIMEYAIATDIRLKQAHISIKSNGGGKPFRDEATPMDLGLVTKGEGGSLKKGYCHNCWEWGHFKGECKNPQRPRPRDLPTRK
jgi:hypothetical protein